MFECFMYEIIIPFCVSLFFSQLSVMRAGLGGGIELEMWTG